MQTFIASREELSATVSSAVEEAVTKRLPEIIKRATRKEYYTISEACEMLDCTRRHIQYLRDSGQLSYIKNGKKIYFRAEDLEAFFQENYIEAGVRK